MISSLLSILNPSYRRSNRRSCAGGDASVSTGLGRHAGYEYNADADTLVPCCPFDIYQTAPPFAAPLLVATEGLHRRVRGQLDEANHFVRELPVPRNSKPFALDSVPRHQSHLRRLPSFRCARAQATAARCSVECSFAPPRSRTHDATPFGLHKLSAIPALRIAA